MTEVDYLIVGQGLAGSLLACLLQMEGEERAGDRQWASHGCLAFSGGYNESDHGKTAQPAIAG